MAQRKPELENHLLRILDTKQSSAENLSDLGGIHDGLELRMVEGMLTFDRPTFIRPMATATLRGLSGHAVLKYNPLAFDTFFKPSPQEDLPPAYLFQAMEKGGGKQETFRFRTVSWDPEGAWIDALQECLWMARGIPFGNSGARVTDVDWAEVYRLRYASPSFDGDEMNLTLKSPLQLRRKKRRVRAEELTFGQLVRASVIRINLLSATYGNGLQVDPMPYLQDALDVRELDRQVFEVSPRRHSCTQDNRIQLGGVLGTLRVCGVSERLSGLLAIAQILHLGRHTVEGCGRVLTEPLTREETNRATSCM